MPDTDKKTENFRVHMSQAMFVAVSRQAAEEGRSLSEFTWWVLHRYLYGTTGPRGNEVPDRAE